MNRLAASKARQEFSEAVNRVAYGHERIVLHRRGREVAALVPVEDLALLEAMEDRLDMEEAEKALAEARRRRQKPIPWEKVKEQLGL